MALLDCVLSASLVLACSQWWPCTRRALSASMWSTLPLAQKICPASVDCQAVPSIWCKHQRELCQGRPSVDVDICRCDKHAGFLSLSLSTWTWTWPNAASYNEENMLGWDDNSVRSCSPFLWSRTSCWKSTAEEISISLLLPSEWPWLFMISLTRWSSRKCHHLQANQSYSKVKFWILHE